MASRFVIWQGDLDEVSMGHVHRVVQIAVANTYMRALLHVRALS